jgi:hypothetical protein
MKQETVILLVAAGVAVAYFGGFIPNTAPWQKKQAAAPAAATQSSAATTANTLGTYANAATTIAGDIQSLFG